MNETVRAYDLDAAAYVASSPQVPDSVRADVEDFVARLGAVTRRGGLLRVSLKEGEGDGWSTHGSISQPRHFTYWRADALRVAMAGTGWTKVDLRSDIAGKRSESWLELAAVRG